jgi:hypothetical protein
MIIKIIIIATAAWVLFFGLSGRRTHFARAWKKIGVLLLVLAMLIAVLFPDTTTRAANLVGVGRGADLLLYLLALTFLTYIVNAYLHQQDEKDALYRLARKVAILDANERYDISKK